MAGAALLGCGIAAVVGAAVPALDVSTRTIRWADVTPVHAQLTARGLTARSFDARVEEIRRANAKRVREGDLDHLVFYLLQSTRFTTLPPIEPALSARAHHDTGHIPDDVRARAVALVRALDSSSSDARLAFFRELVASSFPDRTERLDALLGEYARAMPFVYQKEFVAQRSDRPADAVAELYRTRGLSTDTAVEAGYLVYQGLGVVKALKPARRIRRMLIVGPGLDLAPRTGLLESAPPESYQPWAVIDALFALGLSRPGELELFAADINPRVIAHLRRSVLKPPMLTLASGIEESATLTFAPGYRDYFAQLGAAIGAAEASAAENGARLRKRVHVRPEAVRALRPVRLDIVSERIYGRPEPEPPSITAATPAESSALFDLVIATNILPYFGEVELMLAMSNVAAMLKPGGVFLHNEPRSSLGDIAADVGLAFDQLRQATLATVRGAPKPLADVIFLHTKRSAPAR